MEGRDLHWDRWRMSPVLFAFKAKAALGERPTESTVEVSGGLVAQVSDSVPPLVLLLTVSVVSLLRY